MTPYATHATVPIFPFVSIVFGVAFWHATPLRRVACVARVSHIPKATPIGMKRNAKTSVSHVSHQESPQKCQNRQNRGLGGTHNVPNG
jgi:hypothetical protein